MVRRHKNSILIFLCFQAMAVAIICFGSLINFHQYKIWGKPLIPNFVGYKRDIEKYSKSLSFSKLSRDHQHLQNDFHAEGYDVPVHNILSYFNTGYSVSFDLSQKVPVTSRLSSSGLRGPPIS
jgi:hypothetical protein